MGTSVTGIERQVGIPSGRRTLRGILNVPTGATGVVAFAHGSGSGRFSPRNQFVARILQEASLATLLLDLLEEDEAEDREKVFDIELLAERLQSAADWLNQEPATGALRLGYFGASTGAGAALVAAARAPAAIGAVVSRGGRPDLAGEHLSLVRAPTLLIVGGNDDVVVELNQQALILMRCPKELEVIPGATHLFPEPGALEEVARLAKEWFVRYLQPQNKQVPEEKQSISAEQPRGEETKLAEPAVPPALPHQPGIVPGPVDITGIAPEGTRIDPDITEGHPGYEESGDSEIIPTERLAGEATGAPSQNK